MNLINFIFNKLKGMKCLISFLHSMGTIADLIARLADASSLPATTEPM